MIKKYLYFLLIALFFTGCVERGYTIKTIQIQQSTKELKNITKKYNEKTIDKIMPLEERSGKREEGNSTIESSQESLFPIIENETKNTLSGLFIVLISLIVFL